MPKSFYQLTERSQVLRLRQMATKALEQYDLAVARLRLITNEMNAIFGVKTTDGNKYILRITLPGGGHTQQHVQAEMDWLAALSRDTELSVPQPLPTRDGRLVVEVACNGIPERRMCVIFTWVPGSDLAQHLDEANMSKLGRLSAQLHAHAATFNPPPGFDILHFDKVFPFPEPVVLFEDALKLLFPPERRKIYQQAIDWAQNAIQRLFASGEPMRVIHNDLHMDNVRIHRGVLSPIDFEDLMWGWPVQDIAITLYYFYPLENYPELRLAFQKGYTSISPWPERYPGEIDAFIAARGVGLVNFALQDPHTLQTFDSAGYAVKIEGRLRALLESRR